MSAPADSNHDQRFDQEMKRILKADLTPAADQRIRSHLEKLPEPQNTPAWISSSGPQSKRANVLRFSWASLLVAALVSLLLGAALHAIFFTPAKPIVEQKDAPKKSESPEQNIAVTPEKNERPFLGPDTQHPLLKKPKLNEQINDVLQKLQTAISNKNYSEADELNRQLQKLIEAAKSAGEGR